MERRGFDIGDFLTLNVSRTPQASRRRRACAAPLRFRYARTISLFDIVSRPRGGARNGWCGLRIVVVHSLG